MTRVLGFLVAIAWMAFFACGGDPEIQPLIGDPTNAKSTAVLGPCPDDPDRECVNDDPISGTTSPPPLGRTIEPQQATAIPTATPIPPTATSVPPTATRVPPTAVPATATRIPPTPVPPTVRINPVVPPAGNCDPNYTGACIPPFPPDLDCAQIAAKRFASVGSDPHRLDADKDGIACES